MITGLLLCSFAAFRATRLVVIDSIVQPLRDRLVISTTEATGWRSKLGWFVIDLTNCPHCTGWWMSMTAGLVWCSVTNVGLIETAVFCWAVAGAQSLLSSIAMRLDDDDSE
jgi:hypothetical protein